MRYELYTRTLEHKNYEYYYRFSSDDINSIFLFMENNPLPKKSKYIIIDNNTPNPINHFQLGLQEPPTAEKHYQIIYECKISKVCYEHILYQNTSDENSVDDWDNILIQFLKWLKMKLTYILKIIMQKQYPKRRLIKGHKI